MEGFGIAAKPPEQTAPKPPMAGAAAAPEAAPAKPAGMPLAPGLAVAPKESKRRPGFENAKQAPPELQEKYNRFVGFGMMALYDEKFMKGAVKAMKASNSPVEGVARVAASVASRVYASSRKSGYDLPGEVVLHGGAELLELTKEMAEAAGVAKMDDDQTEAAFYLAADMFRSALHGQGLINKEAALTDLNEFRVMEQDGRLADVMAHFNKGGFGAGGPAPQQPAPMPPEQPAPQSPAAMPMERPR